MGKRDSQENFPPDVKRKVRRRSDNRCERCKIDLDEGSGEFHHIVPLAYGGANDPENCSLLCSDCHRIAPNVKTERDRLIYDKFFLRFASFKEAASYYDADTRLGVYLGFAFELAESEEGKRQIEKGTA